MTFSLLTFDKKRKLFAAGSATGNLCVGGWVIRGDIRFGMSASQGALPSIIWGEDTIKYMAEGNNAQKAIDKAIKNDLDKDKRQISAIDINGNTGVFSGSKNLPEIHHIQKENFVASGNILSSNKVLETMYETYIKTDSSPERKILNALKRAYNIGGDKRGLMSASILILSNEKPPLSLRIDYSKNPLDDLEILLNKCDQKEYKEWMELLPKRKLIE